MESFAKLGPTVSPEVAPEQEPKLREELDRLNGELRVLKSTDYAVRAYVETWVFVVTALATSKLLYDWHHTHGKPPVIAIPVASLSLLVFADSMLQRFKQRFVANDEERRLKRQRELRRLLRVDEVTLPAITSPASTAG